MSDRDKDRRAAQDREEAREFLEEAYVELGAAPIVIIAYRAGKIPFGDLSESVSEASKRRAQRRTYASRTHVSEDELVGFLDKRVGAGGNLSDAEADTLVQEVRAEFPNVTIGRSVDDMARLLARANEFADDAYDTMWSSRNVVLVAFWKDL